MSKNRELREIMVAVLFGEADEETRRHLEAAMVEDQALRQEFRELSDTMSFVNRAQGADDPGPEFWKGVWPKLQERMAKDKIETGPDIRAKASIWEYLRPAFQIGAVAALLVVGIFIGQALNEQIGQSPEPTPVYSGTPTFINEKEINEQKHNYVLNAAQSSMVKSGDVLNDFLRLSSDDSEHAEELISYNRKRSSELLDELYLIRSSLAEPQFEELSMLFEEIEIFVSEIATLEGYNSDVAFEIKLLQRGIEERKLLDRMYSFRILASDSKDSAGHVQLKRIDR